MATTPSNHTKQPTLEADRFLAKLQALQEVNLELARTTSLTELYRAAIELGRTRLGFDRLGLLLYDEATNSMIGTFGTDENGEIRDERDFNQPVRDNRLLEILDGKQSLGVWENTPLHDEGEIIGEGWNAMSVLWSGEKGIGWLAADNHLNHAPLEKHQLDILHLYGANLGHLVLARQLAQQQKELLERRTQQVIITTQVAQAIASAANLEDLYQRIVTEIKEKFGYYYAQLLRIDPASNAVRLIAGYGDIGEQMLAKHHKMALGEGLIGGAAATGKTFLRPDLTDDPDWRPNPLLPDTKGEIAVPIKLGSQILGVLDIQSSKIGALNEEDQLLLEGLCGQIAVAMDTTRLTTELMQFKLGMERSTEVIFLTDTDGTITYVNDAFVETYGFTKEESVGQTPRILKSGMIPPEQYSHFWQTLLSGNIVTGEIINKTKDGRFLNIAGSNNPITDDSGQIIGFLALHRDITKRKQIEEALHLSEQTTQEILHKQKALHQISVELAAINDLDELYQQVIIQARERLGFDRVGLYLLDLDTQIMSGTYGVSPEGNIRPEHNDTFSIKNEPWVKEFIYNKERLMVDEDTDLFEQQKVIGRGWHMVAALWVQDTPVGVIFADNLISQEPLKPYQSELLTAYGTSIANLIERKRADIQVRQSQERAEAILQSVTVPMLISSIADGVILYANEHLAQTIGLPLDEMIGNQTPNFYVRSEDRAAVIAKIKAEGGFKNYELQLQRANGNRFWALLTTKLIQFEGETAIITSLLDITDRREAQEAITRQATELKAVANLSTQVAAIQDPQTLMEMVVQETQRQFDLYHCHIFLLDEAGRQLRIQACGWHPTAKEYGTHDTSTIAINNEKSLVAQAVRTQQVVVENDVLNNPDWLPNELLPDTRSEMAVPMITGGRVLGVLDVQSAELDRFTAEDIQIHSTLAAQMAIALENARSLARSQQAIEEMDLLTRRLTREGWAEYAAMRTDRDAGYVYNLGQLSPIKEAAEKSESTEGVYVEVETAVPASNGAVSHPLTIHGEAIGRLTILDEDGENEDALDRDSQAIILAVAEQLSARIENIRLTEQTQEALAQTQTQAQRLSLLNEISSELSNQATLQEVFNLVVARMPELMDIDRISLLMLKPDGRSLEIAAYRGSENELPPGNSVPLANTPVAEAFQENRLVAGQLDDNIFTLTAPLFVAKRPVGALNIGAKRQEAISSREENMLQQLATMLSSIIENKQLLAAAQARAERERLVRTITDKIRRGTDREAILTIARQEISEMLGANQSVAQLGAKAQLLERLQQSAKSGMKPENEQSS